MTSDIYEANIHMDCMWFNDRSRRCIAAYIIASTRRGDMQGGAIVKEEWGSWLRQKLRQHALVSVGCFL